ncbi:hypothetical protein JZ751_011456 [Albula glossodonta]|uniref:Uncharacterized protein n=1 Tax=Albula glossodonta TaxID=121402 RepID=A0A8T2N6T2_9TELE|nr:hypothetical protein JZ751_011456 [Albula glossodonta]
MGVWLHRWGGDGGVATPMGYSLYCTVSSIFSQTLYFRLSSLAHDTERLLVVLTVEQESLSVNTAASFSLLYGFTLLGFSLTLLLKSGEEMEAAYPFRSSSS